MRNWVKRLLVLMVVLSFAALALAGCGGSAAPEPKKEAPKTEAKTDAKAGTEAKKEEIKFPAKPVKLVVARPAGGSTDIGARLLQPFLAKYLGGTVIIENVAGAGGKLGNDQVFKAAPDGHTMLVANFPSDALKQVVSSLPYDMTKYTPIYSFTGGSAPVAMVNMKSPIKTLDDLIAAGKAKRLLMATTMGAANSPLAYAYFSKNTGVTFDLVPYESGTEAMTATIGGHTDVTFANSIDAVAIHNKEIRVLSVFLPKRLKTLPDVPAFAEKFPGIEVENTFGLLAPPNTPKAVVDILAAAMDKATKDQDLIKAAGNQFDIVPLGPADYAKAIENILKKSSEVKDILMQFESTPAPAAKDKAKK